MTKSARPRVYLAGPEVFLPDAMDIGRQKAAAAAEFGLDGLFPLDQQLDLSGQAKHVQARHISLANEALMRSCDLLIANLTPFRGVSMDSGTAYEVGFMRALGRPVLGYSNVLADYRTRALAFQARGIPSGDCDGPGIEVEDFGLAENLMIAVAIRESGGSVVLHQVSPGQEMRDLRGFRGSLEEARALLDG